VQCFGKLCSDHERDAGDYKEEDKDECEHETVLILAEGHTAFQTVKLSFMHITLMSVKGEHLEHGKGEAINN
jgi:hypothetical protein